MVWCSEYQYSHMLVNAKSQCTNVIVERNSTKASKQNKKLFSSRQTNKINTTGMSAVKMV
jgi:hypothetical protein